MNDITFEHESDPVTEVIPGMDPTVTQSLIRPSINPRYGVLKACFPVFAGNTLREITITRKLDHVLSHLSVSHATEPRHGAFSFRLKPLYHTPVAGVKIYHNPVATRALMFPRGGADKWPGILTS